MRRFLRSKVVAVFAVIVALPSVYSLWWWFNPSRTPLERAYYECGLCGLSEAQIEEIIRLKRESAWTREQELASLRELFTKPSEAEVCEQCAVADLDAAATSPLARLP